MDPQFNETVLKPAAAEKRFQAGNHSGQDCVIQLDEALIIRYIQGSLPNCLLDGMVGSGILDHLSDAHERSQVRLHLQEAHETGEPVVFKTWVSAVDGEPLLIEMRALPCLDPLAGIHKWVWLTCRNVTELNRLESEAQAQAKRLLKLERFETISNMTSSIVHDFNGLLHPILAFSSMGLRKTEQMVNLQSYFNSINTAASRARDVAEKILIFGRVDDSEPKPVQLQSIIAEVVEMERVCLPASIRIELDIDQGCRMVEGDPTRFHQLIMNLLTNAGHAMQKTGGRLNIRFGMASQLESSKAVVPGSTPDQVCLQVSDTGSGIPPDVVEKIFEPFFSTKPTSQGTGLGLSIVAQIVKEYRGRIDVSSKPGEGTTFRIYLPVSSQVPAKSTADGDVGALAGSERLLLVDRDGSLMSNIKLPIRALGYQVTVMADGNAAWNTVKLDPTAYDLVIADIFSPGLTGHQLALRVLDIRPDMPVIMTVPADVSINLSQSRAIGICEFLVKPYSPEKLVSAVRRVIG